MPRRRQLALLAGLDPGGQCWYLNSRCMAARTRQEPVCWGAAVLVLVRQSSEQDSTSRSRVSSSSVGGSC